MRLVLILLITFCFNNTIHAQFLPEHQAIVKGGYLIGNGEDNNESVTGYVIGVNYEIARLQRNVSFGFELMYLEILDDIQLDSGPKVIDYYSVPISVYSNFYFSQSSIKPYIGLGLGVHFSKAITDNFNISQSDRGLVVGFPAGVRWFISDRIILTADYHFYYLGSSFLGNNLAHTFNGGIGVGF